METAEVGRVLTEARIENLTDLWDIKRGLRPADQARAVSVPDALVDSGAMFLSLPTNLIRDLGLTKVRDRQVCSSLGVGAAGVYDAVQLTIMGRTCTMDVMECPEGTPVLIGQLPLEALDFVVDLRNRILIANPAHGGELIVEMY
jgi:predicted aspartyl protease